jgi:hypothetical protein
MHITEITVGMMICMILLETLFVLLIRLQPLQYSPLQKVMITEMKSDICKSLRKRA